MFGEKAKALFAKLEMEYPAVAVKFTYNKPEGVEALAKDEELSFCQFARKAQDEDRCFCIAASNDNCAGKYILGMTPRPAEEASGWKGEEMGAFRSAAANARIHALYPRIPEGTINYVTFCPVAKCDFEPDLVICVCSTPKAQLIMRASSYVSGDFWESKTSFVVSCEWLYAYPYLSGKVNFTVTGMHVGMQRRKVYPAGLHLISIPYQKLDEVIIGLEEMPWEIREKKLPAAELSGVQA